MLGLDSEYLPLDEFSPESTTLTLTRDIPVRLQALNLPELSSLLFAKKRIKWLILCPLLILFSVAIPVFEAR